MLISRAEKLSTIKKRPVDLEEGGKWGELGGLEGGKLWFGCIVWENLFPSLLDCSGEIFWEVCFLGACIPLLEGTETKGSVIVWWKLLRLPSVCFMFLHFPELSCLESLEETINGSKRCTEWNQEPFSFELRYVKTDSQPSLFSCIRLPGASIRAQYGWKVSKKYKAIRV